MVNAIAKALEIEPEAAAKAIEEGRVQLNLATGPSGERLVLVAMDGRTALIAANAIERAPATNPSSCHNDQ